MMTEEIKTLLTVIRHREIVRDYLESLAGYFRWRAMEHDRSKLQFDEFEGFTKINRVARDHGYGTKEYDDALASEKDEEGCIALHYGRNRHHPEFHGQENEMGLLDLIEMVIDWKAASEVYGNYTLEEGLVKHRQRFDFDDWQWRVIEDMVVFVDGGPQKLLMKDEGMIDG